MGRGSEGGFLIELLFHILWYGIVLGLQFGELLSLSTTQTLNIH
jgi:hypothetical protein